MLVGVQSLHFPEPSGRGGSSMCHVQEAEISKRNPIRQHENASLKGFCDDKPLGDAISEEEKSGTPKAEVCAAP
jgi:hypothetical protein